MAQTSVYSLTDTGDMDYKRESVADFMAHLAQWETAFLTKVGLNSLEPENLPSDTTYLYNEIQERPNRTTLATTVNSSATTFVLTDAIYPQNTLIRINEEIIKLGSTSDRLTYTGCSRTQGTAVAAAHVALDHVVGQGIPTPTGMPASPTGDLVIMPDAITSYTRIFQKHVAVTGTASVLDRVGREGTEVDYQIIRQMKTLNKEVEASILDSVAVAPSGTGPSGTAGSFDGLRQRILAVSGSTDIAGRDVKLSDFQTAERKIRDYGGTPDTILCGLRTSGVIGNMGLPHVIVGNEPVMEYGKAIDVLRVGDSRLEVLVTADVSSDVWILDSSQIKMGPLTSPKTGANREFAAVKMGEEGDRVLWQITGEFGLQIPTARTHQMLTSAKWTL